MDEVERWTRLARAMLSHTTEYVGSARRLRERITAADGLDEDFPTVAVVADALAAEIALKAFIVMRERIESPEGLRAHLRNMNRHHLSGLFARVEPTIQAEIVSDVVERMDGSVRILVTGYPGEVARVSYTGNLGFAQLLERHSTCFEAWRYPYEHPVIWVAHSFGTALAASLEKALERALFPDGVPAVLPRGPEVN